MASRRLRARDCGCRRQGHRDGTRTATSRLHACSLPRGDSRAREGFEDQRLEAPTLVGQKWIRGNREKIWRSVSVEGREGSQEVKAAATSSAAGASSATAPSGPLSPSPRSSRDVKLEQPPARSHRAHVSPASSPRSETMAVRHAAGQMARCQRESVNTSHTRFYRQGRSTTRNRERDDLDEPAGSTERS